MRRGGMLPLRVLALALAFLGAAAQTFTTYYSADETVEVDPVAENFEPFRRFSGLATFRYPHEAAAPAVTQESNEYLGTPEAGSRLCVAGSGRFDPDWGNRFRDQLNILNAGIMLDGTKFLDRLRVCTSCSTVYGKYSLFYYGINSTSPTFTANPRCILRSADGGSVSNVYLPLPGNIMGRLENKQVMLPKSRENTIQLSTVSFPVFTPSIRTHLLKNGGLVWTRIRLPARAAVYNPNWANDGLAYGIGMVLMDSDPNQLADNAFYRGRSRDILGTAGILEPGGVNLLVGGIDRVLHGAFATLNAIKVWGAEATYDACYLAQIVPAENYVQRVYSSSARACEGITGVSTSVDGVRVRATISPWTRQRYVNLLRTYDTFAPPDTEYVTYGRPYTSYQELVRFKVYDGQTRFYPYVFRPEADDFSPVLAGYSWRELAPLSFEYVHVDSFLERCVGTENCLGFVCVTAEPTPQRCALLRANSYSAMTSSTPAERYITFSAGDANSMRGHAAAVVVAGVRVAFLTSRLGCRSRLADPYSSVGEAMRTGSAFEIGGDGVARAPRSQNSECIEAGVHHVAVAPAGQTPQALPNLSTVPRYRPLGGGRALLGARRLEQACEGALWPTWTPVVDYFFDYRGRCYLVYERDGYAELPSTANVENLHGRIVAATNAPQPIPQLVDCGSSFAGYPRNVRYTFSYWTPASEAECAMLMSVPDNSQPIVGYHWTGVVCYVYKMDAFSTSPLELPSELHAKSEGWRAFALPGRCPSESSVDASRILVRVDDGVRASASCPLGLAQYTGRVVWGPDCLGAAVADGTSCVGIAYARNSQGCFRFSTLYMRPGIGVTACLDPPTSNSGSDYTMYWYRNSNGCKSATLIGDATHAPPFGSGLLSATKDSEADCAQAAIPGGGGYSYSGTTCRYYASAGVVLDGNAAAAVFRRRIGSAAPTTTVKKAAPPATCPSEDAVPAAVVADGECVASLAPLGTTHRALFRAGDCRVYEACALDPLFGTWCTTGGYDHYEMATPPTCTPPNLGVVETAVDIVGVEASTDRIPYSELALPPVSGAAPVVRTGLNQKYEKAALKTDVKSKSACYDLARASRIGGTLWDDSTSRCFRVADPISAAGAPSFSGYAAYGADAKRSFVFRPAYP